MFTELGLIDNSSIPEIIAQFTHVLLDWDHRYLYTHAGLIILMYNLWYGTVQKHTHARTHMHTHTERGWVGGGGREKGEGRTGEKR